MKSYIGMGILAAPEGYLLVGYFLATTLIIINGALNAYTVNL